MATNAADTLQAHSWLARHPYLFSLAFGFGALAGNVILVACVAQTATIVSRATHFDPRIRRLVAEAAVQALNWLTPMAGGAFLCWIARRFPVGWKTLVSASIGLALAASIIGVWSNPHFAPGYGPPNSQVSIVLADSPLGYLYLLCVGDFDYLRRVLQNHGMHLGAVCLARLLLPVVAVRGCRYMIVARTTNPRSSVPPAAIS